jgi:hypothetical protein
MGLFPSALSFASLISKKQFEEGMFRINFTTCYQ